MFCFVLGRKDGEGRQEEEKDEIDIRLKASSALSMLIKRILCDTNDDICRHNIFLSRGCGQVIARHEVEERW